MSHSSSLVGHQTKSKVSRSLEEKDWYKVGGDIQGKQLGSQFGDSVAISKDGDVIAVGARFKDTPEATNTGVVRVFQRDGSGGWDQKGDDIAGKSRGDFFGKSISLSDDGSILAVGSPKYDEHGMVRVYKFDEDGNMWKLLGDDIGGVSDESPIGCFISLSGDGLTLAISWDDNDGTGLNVRIFKFEDDSWVKLRTDALSPVQHDVCPSVSLSETGDILALGGMEKEDDAPSKGRVRVYQFNDNEWSQLGQVIDDEAVNLGKGVSLSDDGLSLATSGGGIARVYHLDVDKDEWVADEDIAHFGGKGVSLSGDGTKLAVGDSQDNEFCFEDPDQACIDGPGAVEVYQQEGKKWKTLGSTLLGRTLVNNGDRFGFSVALSQNGESLVVGAPNRHKMQEFGYASVFDFTSPPSDEPPTVDTDSGDKPTDPFEEQGPSKVVTDDPGRSRDGLSTAAQISIGSVGGFLLAAVFVVAFLKIKKRKKETNERFPIHEPVSE